jgi:AraC-like DNA-binding protein
MSVATTNTSPRNYIQLLPSPRFLPFIHSYHLHRGHAYGNNLVDFYRFPGGNVDLFLQFGSNKFCSATHGIIPPLSVFGPRTYLEHFIADSTLDLVIRGNLFFPIALYDLTNRVVPLDQLWPASIIQPIYELTILPCRQRLERLEQILLRQMGLIENVPRYLFRAVDTLQHFGGQILISTVARTFDISTSQLERSFQRYVGVTPKSLARVMRFQMTVWHIRQHPPRSWADFALDRGYADQAHFIRDFTSFVDFTPTEFVQFKPNAAFVQYNEPS